jgi:hypothetical protein
MAKPALNQHFSLLLLTLCILVGCLAFHSVMEDIFLLPGVAVPDSMAGNLNELSYEEIEHQDDLVFLSSLAVRISDVRAPAGFIWILPIEKKSGFPIFHPPQI